MYQFYHDPLAPPEWTEFVKRLLKLQELLRQEIKKFPEKKQSKFHVLKSEGERRLYDNTPRCYLFVAYHISVMGGANYSMAPGMDYPGENTVENFYSSFLEEIKKQSN